MLAAAALLPRLSLALTWTVSAAAMQSESLNVARSAFTWESDPVIVKLAVPEPVTPAPLALSRPLVSVSVAVNVSPAVVPVSEDSLR